MSRAVLAPRASARSTLPSAYRLCGATRLSSRKYAGVSYRFTTRARAMNGRRCGVAPE